MPSDDRSENPPEQPAEKNENPSNLRPNIADCHERPAEDEPDSIGEDAELHRNQDRPEMVDPNSQSMAGFDWLALSERWMLLGTAGILLTLLIVARFLTPSPTGIGTHQGLGLPPCQFRFLTGVDCPSCGMTTSWAHLTRGDFVSSFRANPGGLMLGLFAFVMAVWMLLSGWKGHWWPVECRPFWLILTGVGIFTVTIVNWVLKITA